MSLESIISISGKPGLYKVISQTKNGLIVESLQDNKRVPVYSSERVSALEDISIYTYSDDIPLKEVYESLIKETSGKEAISHKSSINELSENLRKVLPEFDEGRVYNSDLKKLFQWFNILVKAKVLALPKEEKKTTSKTENTTAKKPATKKSPAKKTTNKEK